MQHMQYEYCPCCDLDNISINCAALIIYSNDLQTINIKVGVYVKQFLLSKMLLLTVTITRNRHKDIRCTHLSARDFARGTKGKEKVIGLHVCL